MLSDLEQTEEGSPRPLSPPAVARRTKRNPGPVRSASLCSRPRPILRISASTAMRTPQARARRYPTNSRPSTSDLRNAVARKLSVRPENVVMGAGSRELLRSAVRIFTSPTRHLITAAPSYEQPEKMAEQIGVPVRRVPVDKNGRLDLDKMGEAAHWSGLVYICNPNNPTATVHAAKAVADFASRLRKESPETAILIDEAYHDYVTDPG